MRSVARVVRISVVGAVALASVAAPSAVAAPSPALLVPITHPTIQAAVDAASTGDRIRILPGTYAEQVSIDKDLSIAGSGLGATIIQAPSALVPGADATNNIVEIDGGASVAISGLTVSGPGSGTCEDGSLGSGIRVINGAHLDLAFVRVRRIRDTPMADCFPSGNGILVGDFGAPASATVHHSQVTDFQLGGIIVLGEGSTADISYNVVTGPGRSQIVATGGIELLEASGRISHNVISGNACGSADLGCGPDFFNQFQLAGITAFGQHIDIDHNLVFANQVGIYAGAGSRLQANRLLYNDYFGLALQDGIIDVSRDTIVGGEGGVAVVAASADTTANLDRVRIVGTETPVQEFECCGFTATVVRTP